MFKFVSKFVDSKVNICKSCKVCMHLQLTLISCFTYLMMTASQSKRCINKNDFYVRSVDCFLLLKLLSGNSNFWHVILQIIFEWLRHFVKYEKIILHSMTSCEPIFCFSPIFNYRPILNNYNVIKPNKKTIENS